MDRRTRARRIRDPIHGDVYVGPVQAAAIDTLEFQRLRYIRQNGLLHFVFPGAVHTRFAHSIGAMSLARKVFSRIFPDYGSGRNSHALGPEDHVSYIGTCFELAALLHDVGHCAFSHSIENVIAAGQPFMRTMDQVAQAWDEMDTGAQYATFAHEYRGAYPTAEFHHEQLGLLFVGRLVRQESFQEVLRHFVGSTANVDATCSDLARDIRALLAPKLDHSGRFATAADYLLRTKFETSLPSATATFFRREIATLISGTLDVDRLDYLIRDSTYTGVPYGACDVELLLGALDLHVLEIEGATQGIPQPKLVLDIRAAAALEDMLWSRYQLFHQVLNHKTNVILNEMLKEALADIVDAGGSVALSRPKYPDDFLELTDDRVMADVFRACVRDAAARKRPYAAALVFRRLPTYLGYEDVDSFSAATLAEATERVARREMVDARILRIAQAESKLIKLGGLPLIRQFRKRSGQYDFQPAEKRLPMLQWNDKKFLPAETMRAHFFIGEAREMPHN